MADRGITFHGVVLHSYAFVFTWQKFYVENFAIFFYEIKLIIISQACIGPYRARQNPYIMLDLEFVGSKPYNLVITLINAQMDGWFEWT